SGLGNLVCSVIGKGSGFRNDTYPPLSKHKAGHNSHLGFTRCKHTGAVGAIKRRTSLLDVRLYLQHVFHGNSLSDGNNYFNTCLGRLHNSICRKSRRNKYDGSVGTGSLNRVLNGIKNGFVEVFASSFTWSNATYYICTVFYHLLRMERPFSPCKTLHNYFRIFIYQYTHNAIFKIYTKIRE